VGDQHDLQLAVGLLTERAEHVVELLGPTGGHDRTHSRCGYRNPCVRYPTEANTDSTRCVRRCASYTPRCARNACLSRVSGSASSASIAARASASSVTTVTVSPKNGSMLAAGALTIGVWAALSSKSRLAPMVLDIALVNEMARFCHELEIDLWDVIRCAATKPFGFQAFFPGPGVGGHCIPIDPNYLSHNVRAKLGYPFRFVELAEEINATMPAYVAHRAQNLLNEDGKAIHGSSVLLLGVTYKPDIADQRESPAVPLARHLSGLGADVVYHDPRVDDWRAGVPVTRAADWADDLDSAVRRADLVVLVQHHQEYDVAALAGRAQLFFDTRGVTTGPEARRL
jgi:hypothetical protein